MSSLGSQEWLDQLKTKGSRLPKEGGADLLLNVEIKEASEGTIRFNVSFMDGQVKDCKEGKNKEADAGLNGKYADITDILSGKTSAGVAYMRGKLKLEGSYEKVLYEFRDIFANLLKKLRS